ncbi:hypothetical protein BH10ACI3_BH10ACI3_22610 [soil metagenome]
MLYIIAVLAFLSAAFLLFRVTRRQDIPLPVRNLISSEPPPNARPLFAPSDAELKHDADEREARDIGRREYRANATDRAAVDSALSVWRTEPDARSAGELLSVTAEKGLAGDFSRAAEEITTKFREQGIPGLTANDLAALLDSHMRLLSESERGSGAIFWLKQEVAKLRTDVFDHRSRSRDPS